MQAKQVKSEYFHNLIYTIYPNGASRTVIRDTEKFSVGSYYSPMELFPECERSRAITQYEIHIKMGYKFHNFVDQFVRDSQYNLEGWNRNNNVLKMVGFVESEIKQYTIQYQSGLSIKTINVYTDTKVLAEQMFKYYASIKKLDDAKVLKVSKSEIELHHSVKNDMLAKSKVLSSGILGAKETFHLEDDRTEIVTNSRYYKWLDENNVTDHNRLHTHQEYLKSIGFDTVYHRLLNMDIDILRFILDRHFQDNLKTK